MIPAFVGSNPTSPAYADMAELADALDLGSSGGSRAGSTPVIRTIKECFTSVTKSLVFLFFDSGFELYSAGFIFVLFDAFLMSFL